MDALEIFLLFFLVISKLQKNVSLYFTESYYFQHKLMIKYNSASLPLTCIAHDQAGHLPLHTMNPGKLPRPFVLSQFAYVPIL